VIRSPADVIAYARSKEGQKFIKYSAVSVIAVIVGEVSLLIFLTVGMTPAWANLSQAAVATVPSYELNRKWAWGKSGKGHLWKEVVPFWALSFIGLGFSELTAIAAGNYASSHHWSHSGKSLLVAAVVLATYGVLWVGKFLVINKILFADHPAEIDPVFDGRSGLPT
jgi:putative flippase GtrA